MKSTHKTTIQRVPVFPGLLFIVVLLTACGGNDGSAAAPEIPAPANNDWDNLVWDQNNWS